MSTKSYYKLEELKFHCNKCYSMAPLKNVLIVSKDPFASSKNLYKVWNISNVVKTNLEVLLVYG